MSIGYCCFRSILCWSYYLVPLPIHKMPLYCTVIKQIKRFLLSPTPRICADYLPLPAELAPFIASATVRAVPLQLNGSLLLWRIRQAMQDDAIRTARIHPTFIPVCGWGWSVRMAKFPARFTEISGTEPARPLIWKHRKFYEEFRVKARSRKPGQPGQPGYCEEALKVPIDHKDNSLWLSTKVLSKIVSPLNCRANSS